MHITRDTTIARLNTSPCHDWATYGDDRIKISDFKDCMCAKKVYNSFYVNVD